LPARKSTVDEVKEEVQKDLAMERYHQNMRFYGQVQTTPQEARKEIQAGRLKGYTDINPMWRIKKLTEIFGPVGFGWWTQNEKFSSMQGLNTGNNPPEVAVFCTLELVVVDPETGEQSHPIMGVGGNKFMSNEKNGPYCNDEAYKSAYTDALSIACKALGFSHDIYYAKDRTKYTMAEEAARADEPSQEELKEIKMRIQKGVDMLTKSMTPDQKTKFSQDVIVKHIGNANYMLCMDMSKLNNLINELLQLASAA
jgi:hypothetical protein